MATAEINENDSILAYHGQLIYEAKVLNTSIEGGEKAFFLHYKGWNKKWNEWVGIDRVMQDTPANRAIQAEAKKELSRQKHQPKRGRPKPEKNYNAKSKKKKTEEQPETEDQNLKQVPISIPFTLKKQLVDEWERVTKEPIQLASLPRAPCVTQIIENYMEHKKLTRPAGQTKLASLRELFDGIRLFFEKALPSVLLYKTERKQYEDIKKLMSGKPMSEIYGAEHLIRLFVRLPGLLGNASVKDAEKRQLQAKLNDFLKYLQKNHTAWFATEYTSVSDDYISENNKL